MRRKNVRRPDDYGRVRGRRRGRGRVEEGRREHMRKKTR